MTTTYGKEIRSRRGFSKRNSRFKGSGVPGYQPKKFRTHIAAEFLTVAELVSRRFHREVYLIGIRAAYEHGVKPWRVTEDFDIYVPLTLTERDELTKEVTARGGTYQWTAFGITYRLGDERIDINFLNPIREEDLRRRARRIQGSIYALSLEDLIVAKLISPRRKDRIDAGKLLKNTHGRYNMGRLKEIAMEAKVLPELVKTARRYGVKSS